MTGVLRDVQGPLTRHHAEYADGLTDWDEARDYRDNACLAVSTALLTGDPDRIAHRLGWQAVAATRRATLLTIEP